MYLRSIANQLAGFQFEKKKRKKLIVFCFHSMYFSICTLYSKIDLAYGFTIENKHFHYICFPSRI